MSADCRDASKLWGGRFEDGPSEVFERFSGSLHFDRRLFQADILGSQAYARLLLSHRSAFFAPKSPIPGLRPHPGPRR